MTRALYAEFTVLPGAEARVTEMMLELSALVRAEPGNLAFVPYTLEENPRHWFVYEVYADEAAFLAHLGADYAAAFNTELAGLIEQEASQITWLSNVE